MVLTKNDVGKYFRTRNGSLAFVVGIREIGRHRFDVRLLEYISSTKPMWKWKTCTIGGFMGSESNPYTGDLTEPVPTDLALAELALLWAEPPRL